MFGAGEDFSVVETIVPVGPEFDCVGDDSETGPGGWSWNELALIPAGQLGSPGAQYCPVCQGCALVRHTRRELTCPGTGCPVRVRFCRCDRFHFPFDTNLFAQELPVERCCSVLGCLEFAPFSAAAVSEKYKTVPIDLLEQHETHRGQAIAGHRAKRHGFRLGCAFAPGLAIPALKTDNWIAGRLHGPATFHHRAFYPSAPVKTMLSHI